MAANEKSCNQLYAQYEKVFLCIVILHVSTWSRWTKKTSKNRPLSRLNAGCVKKQGKRLSVKAAHYPPAGWRKDRCSSAKSAGATDAGKVKSLHTKHRGWQSRSSSTGNVIFQETDMRDKVRRPQHCQAGQQQVEFVERLRCPSLCRNARGLGTFPGSQRRK